MSQQVRVRYKHEENAHFQQKENREKGSRQFSQPGL